MKLGVAGNTVPSKRIHETSIENYIRQLLVSMANRQLDKGDGRCVVDLAQARRDFYQDRQSAKSDRISAPTFCFAHPRFHYDQMPSDGKLLISSFYHFYLSRYIPMKCRVDVSDANNS